ncbi:hypothetical protein DL96DRAFT_1812849 [Flagelloscypha sp. PMI_526]|nr:hypothetical protein DL96DRAFT_1812849 [Flagelloscypha sp. PMI_526]
MAESTSTSITELNMRITYHVEVLQRLRARRNERVSWTHCLPLSIFREILTIYRDNEPPRYRSNYYPSPGPALQDPCSAVPWIAPSHVCQYWRMALLDYAAFWAVLSLNNVKWTDLLLIRSKDTPLTLRPEFNSSQREGTTFRESFYLALRESHRIVHLVISLPEIIHSPAVKNSSTKTFLLCSFAQLKTVRITSSRFTTTPPGGYAPISPRKFLGKIHKWLPSQLTSLKICATSVLAISLTLQSNLTQLEIVDEGGSFGNLSIDRLLRFLGVLPALEHLTLLCTLRHYVEDHKLNQCALEYLKSMDINSMDTSLPTLSSFIEHIDAPFALHISITSAFLRNFNGRLPGSVQANDVGTLQDEQAKASGGSIQQLFSSLSPYLNSQNSHIGNAPHPAREVFQSMLVEADFWSLTTAFSGTEKLNFQISHVWDDYNSFPWKSRSWCDHFDVRIQLQDSYRLQAGYGRPQPDQEDPERLDLLSSDIYLSTLDLFLQSQHVFLSETQECQAKASDLNVVPWVSWLASATHLRDLELRVSEYTLQILLYVLDGWEDGSQPKAEITLPCLESMTFWEFRFQNRFPSSTPNSSLAIDLSPPHEPPVPSHNIIPQVPGQQHSTSYVLDPFTLKSAISVNPGRRLIDSLADRKKAGYPLRKLSFRLCSNFSLEVVREYKIAADEVIWDGVDHAIFVPVGFDDPWYSNPSPQEDYEDSLTGSEPE